MANLFLPKIITWFRLDEHVRRLKDRVDDIENNPPVPVTPTLQQVTEAGNTASLPIRSIDIIGDTEAQLSPQGFLALIKSITNNIFVYLKADNITAIRTIQLPNESGTLVVDAPTDSQNYTRKDNTWVVAPEGGTPSLDAVLGVGNTSTNKVINMNLSSSAIAINVLGNTTNTFRSQIYPGGIMFKNSSNQSVVSMGVSGPGTTGVFRLINTSGTGSIQLRGDNLSVEVNNGGFGGTLVQSALLNDRLTFKQVGGLNCYIKPETVPYDATPEWTLPGAFGKLAVLKTTAPASATDAGVVGEIRVTPTFIYTCVAPNTWVRAAVTTW